MSLEFEHGKQRSWGEVMLPTVSTQSKAASWADHQESSPAAADESQPAADPEVSTPQDSGRTPLPDLKDKPIKDGLLDEYIDYRTRYLEWRQGGSLGAAGELSQIGSSSPSQQSGAAITRQRELWHPTPQKFDFFFTVSYWLTVCNISGAFILVFANLAAILDDGQVLNEKLLAAISFMGDLCYTFSSYLAYLQCINVSHSDDGLVYLFPDWGPLRRKLSPESWIGVVAYLIAMIVWDFSAFIELLPIELEGAQELWLIQVPCGLGASLFMIGGICEVLHNRHSGQLEWKVSVLDCIGDLAFVVGSVCLFIPSVPVKTCRICFVAGMALFLVGGIMMLVMWRVNDFGLALLRQLNDVLRAGSFVNLNVSSVEGGFQIRHAGSQLDHRGHASTAKSRLSTRGVIFIVIYCWLASCSAMNGAASLFAETGSGRILTDVMNSILWLLIVLIVLIIHSAVTSIPNQQPYRFAMLLMRFTLLAGTLSETFSMAKWLPNVKYPLWHSI